MQQETSLTSEESSFFPQGSPVICRSPACFLNLTPTWCEVATLACNCVASHGVGGKICWAFVPEPLGSEMPFATHTLGAREALDYRPFNLAFGFVDADPSHDP